MDTDKLILTLRDVAIRRRRGLPMPDGIDLDQLLEEAAEEIASLEQQAADDHECDNCDCTCGGCDC